MSALITVVPLQPVEVAGRTHSAFELGAKAIELSDSIGTALWVIERVPLYFTITLVELFVIEGSSFSLTLRSEVETATEPWHHIGQLAGATVLRQQPGWRVTAPCRRLVAKVVVGGASAHTVVRARLTLVDDHF